MKARIAAAWPGDDAKALCLVGEETGQTYDPSIKNPSGTYRGLFQADSDFSQAYASVSDASSLSVEEQTAMAWRGYQARGWSPWPPAARC